MSRLVVLVALVCAVASVLAESEDVNPEVLYSLEPKLAAPFGDNAVLQQKIKVPVWGTSFPGAEVTVEFDGQAKTTKVDDDGNWRVELEPMDAPKLKTVNDSVEGKTMTITCELDGKKEVVELKNLIVGDVWICSGQSNMAGRIKTNPSRHWPTNTTQLATYPTLRRKATNGEPWTVCSPETVQWFGKVSFFFARRLQEDALVPVGLIREAVGGSSIESWLNKEPYKTGGNYTRLMEPHVGYGIKGVVWYQGESNARDKRGYEPKLRALISGWREVWGMGEFPFYSVQLPGIGRSETNNPAMGDGRAEIRQSRVEVMDMKNTGLAVTIDIGAPGEHPPNKYDTGDRMARVILRNVYGLDKVATSPLYKSHKVEGSTIRVKFDYAENGLMLAQKQGPLDFTLPTPTPDGKLGWLSIQGNDGKWHWADGKIDPSVSSQRQSSGQAGQAADTLVVSAPGVEHPIAVRYAYTIHPEGPLLYSREGMPVGPFSTIGYGPEQSEEEGKKK